jgi:hypothetical protein
MVTETVPEKTEKLANKSKKRLIKILFFIPYTF